MKRLILFLITFLFISQLSDAQSYDIKLKPKIGEELKYETTIELENPMLAGAKTNTMNIVSYKFMSKKENSYTLQLTFNKMTMNMAMGEFNFNIDSDENVTLDDIKETIRTLKNKEKGEAMYFAMDFSKQLMGYVFSSMKGKHITMVVNDFGKVEKVEGFNELMNSFLDGLLEVIKDIPGLEKNTEVFSLKEVVKNMFEQNFGDNFLKIYEGFFYYIPEKTIKIGDSWSRTASIGYFGTIDNKMKLVSVENGKANISIDGEISNSTFIPDKKEDDNKESNLKEKMIELEMKGNQSGYYLIDMISGMPLEFNATVNMTMNNPNQEGNGTMNLKTVYTTKRIK